jgi:hypothetical protein
MSHQPDLNVAQALASAGLGLTLGTNLFWGKVREVDTASGVPSQAVFVTLRLSPAPENYCDGSITPQAREPQLQVTVRSNPQDFSGGQTLARSVKDALHDIPPSGYDACRVTQAEPVPIGETDSGEHLFSVNVHLWIDE